MTHYLRSLSPSSTAMMVSIDRVPQTPLFASSATYAVVNVTGCVTYMGHAPTGPCDLTCAIIGQSATTQPSSRRLRLATSVQSAISCAPSRPFVQYQWVIVIVLTALVCQLLFSDSALLFEVRATRQYRLTAFTLLICLFCLKRNYLVFSF